MPETKQERVHEQRIVTSIPECDFSSALVTAVELIDKLGEPDITELHMTRYRVMTAEGTPEAGWNVVASCRKVSSNDER